MAIEKWTEERVLKEEISNLGSSWPRNKFFDDKGEMREPTREDFIEGKVGNRQVSRFLHFFYDN